MARSCRWGLAWHSTHLTLKTWRARSRWEEKPASPSRPGATFPTRRREWERDFLIVEEHVPAGATLIEGSVQTGATSYQLADGVLTFYFAPNQNPGVITYDIHGYLPGQYRALPASISSAYEPGRFHLGPASDLRVRAPGEPSTDPYKPTPDELYALRQGPFRRRAIRRGG